jgi:hypothetical protein
MRSPSCVSVHPPYQLLYAWTNIYETRYVYHGTWAHLNGVLHKFVVSVCVSVCVSPYRCYATARQTRYRDNEEFLEASFYMRPVSYQRKAGDQFFPELLVSSRPNTARSGIRSAHFQKLHRLCFHGDQQPMMRAPACEERTSWWDSIFNPTHRAGGGGSGGSSNAM